MEKILRANEFGRHTTPSEAHRIVLCCMFVTYLLWI